MSKQKSSKIGLKQKSKNFEKLAKSISWFESNRASVESIRNSYSGTSKPPNKFKNNVELETALHEEWNQIPRNII